VDQRKITALIANSALIEFGMAIHAIAIKDIMKLPFLILIAKVNI
jgi:hypothetical protein